MDKHKIDMSKIPKNAIGEAGTDVLGYTVCYTFSAAWLDSRTM